MASSQPLATLAGVSALQSGGNAADAAVATAAALAVVEPGSTGIGGDCFSLFYDAGRGVVDAVNGSGRSPKALTPEMAGGPAGFDPQGPHAVTVPGTVAGWVDTVERFGRMSMAEVLAPAIALAEHGFPVTPIISAGWEGQEDLLRAKGPAGHDLLVDGRAPRPGEVWRNASIARVMRAVAEGGADAFYSGWPARAIVEAVQLNGGCMTADDLRDHRSSFDNPISTTYRGYTVYECPPNGQGITALMALNILEGFDIPSTRPRSPEALHPTIEAIRLAFADARAYVADPTRSRVPVAAMLSKRYAAKRRRLISYEGAIEFATAGHLPGGSDTVYLCTVDGEGNACSFINILEGFDIPSTRPRSPEALHPTIEAIRLAFADARAYVADPTRSRVPVAAMLSKRYAAKRRRLISYEGAIEFATAGHLPGGSDTVYLCTVDGEGNACSFINSNYHGFGSGIVPRSCGFSLQNRGAGFVLEADHPNTLEGGKRPYHTIIPAMLTRSDGSLVGPFGVMGGWNQPQGHVQAVINLVDRGMDPQSAIDEPRFSIYDDPPNGPIWVEDTIDEGTISALARLGHPVRPASGALRTRVVGQGQIIVRDPDTGVLWGGSDPRGDGCAIGL